jgi:hypothetical protein
MAPVENPHANDCPRGFERSSLVAFLPENPHSGPIQPTERRTYVLPPEVLKLLGTGGAQSRDRVYVSIQSGAGEELRLDDERTTLLLKSLTAPDDHSAPDINHEQMNKILGLIDKRIRKFPDSQYEVRPPRIFRDDPAIAQRTDVVAVLKGTIFVIKWPDDSIDRVSFEELMVMTSEMIRLALSLREFQEQAKDLKNAEVHLKLNTMISPAAILKPDVVRVLLSKIEFSAIAAEE